MSSSNKCIGKSRRYCEASHLDDLANVRAWLLEQLQLFPEKSHCSTMRSEILPLCIVNRLDCHFHRCNQFGNVRPAHTICNGDRTKVTTLHLQALRMCACLSY